MYYVTIRNNKTKESRERPINLDWAADATDEYIRAFWLKWTDHNLCIEFETEDSERDSNQWHERAYWVHAKKESTTSAKHYSPLRVRIPAQQDRVVTLQ